MRFYHSLTRVFFSISSIRTLAGALSEAWQKTTPKNHKVSISELQLLATDLLEDIAKGKFIPPFTTNDHGVRSLYHDDKTCIHIAILRMTGFDLVKSAQHHPDERKLPSPEPHHEQDARAILAAATLAYLTAYKLAPNENPFLNLPIANG